jgi:hypothetical protein
LKINGAPGGTDGYILNFGFLLEDPNCRETVLYLLKCCQHSLPIDGNLRVVRCDGFVCE